MNDDYLLREFAARFGQPRLFSAPGRINLIGEHTDYNQGFVLPMAIERRTYVAGAPRTDRKVSVRSTNASSEYTFDLDRPGDKQRGLWLDYVEGTAQALIARGFGLSGADLIISSDIPSGAGLSSSAALEISIGFALTRLADGALPSRIELALSGQSAEHDYVGTKCGIMDQFIATMAEPDSALLIDCRSLEPKRVPLELQTACVLICDTRVKHSLADSAYNERRQQCEAGVAEIQRTLPQVKSLRDVTLAMLQSQATALPELILRRCRHVVTENERTLRGADALRAGRLEQFGRLMNESHRSLRVDYEVSCAELDEAVDVASAAVGVYGSRMTGGGFGGCTVTLLEQGAVERVCAAIARRFAERFASTPEFFTSRACEGAHEHTL